MTHRTYGSHRIALGCALIAPVMVLTSCGDTPNPLSSDPYDAGDQVSVSVGAEVSGERTPVDPSKPLEVASKSDDDDITDVVVVDEVGRQLAGELSADGSRWRSTGDLAAGTKYTVRVSTERSGRPGRSATTFGTRPPSAKDKKLKVTFGPDAGTYGVGQPVTAELSRAVKRPAERKVVEGSLEVRSSPEVTGSWHWVDDKKLHYRPKEYWPANTRIAVESKITGLKVRDGLYGGATKTLKLKTGDRVEAEADASSLVMTVKKNGEVLRSIPITTGKAGFRTRNGTKVVLGRESFVRMQSTSIGIGEGSSEFYDMPVYWATRLTWSGEYVHGAPWSSGSHGAANVSHGCTGMSSDNARWFFNTIRSGDLVTHTNTDGDAMDHFGNGFGDWNLDWEEWQKGSAFTSGSSDGSAGPGAPKLDAKDAAEKPDRSEENAGEDARPSGSTDVESSSRSHSAPGQEARLRPQT